MPLPQQFENPEIKRTPEAQPNPERREQPEQQPTAREQHERSDATFVYPMPAAPTAAPTTTPFTRVHQSVERVLEDNLQDVFTALPPEQQAHFRQVGESTAQKITAMLVSAKVAVNSILKLIRNWLKIIPGVNRYYLEQEAKIKSDRIMAIYREEQEK